MNPKTKRLWRENSRFRLMLTLELAVMLPAAALIFVNFHHLKSIKRDKVLEAAIHRDFQEMLAISEKTINKKLYAMAENVRAKFPSPDSNEAEAKEKQLDLILSNNPWLTHVFLFDKDKGMIFRSRAEQMSNRDYHEEHDRLKEVFSGWFGLEGGEVAEEKRKKQRPITWYAFPVKRDHEFAYMPNAILSIPNLEKGRAVLGGASIDPVYLKDTFFRESLEELVASKMADSGGNKLAMAVYPVGEYGEMGQKFLTASSGWKEGKPEVSRNLDDVLRGLALGIKYQGTSVEALGRTWIEQNFILLVVLSVAIIAGLFLTYRSVSKEVALARLKSDFVSNVSHELRTPLALIRLYAETLELGRIKTQEKMDEYYRIIRKESERLTALINNILDFSRIEAGRKEYDFRETDIAELVQNTLDAYRFQIEQKGFAFETSIDSSLPPMRVDREAIARALVNLINNALKYSANDRFLSVKLYRENEIVKLEVIDRGIGITRREQTKIFEKFYRTGDPLVHNTKGSGLGLSLVRHITQAHGGEVEVESTPGKGSKFTVSLPLAATAR
jgi:signal transduction histidine kinase